MAWGGQNVKAIETTVTVSADGKAALQVPADVPPGEHRAVLVIDAQPIVRPTNPPADFPVIHVESWPADLSLRREDLYDDWGR